MGSKMKKPKAPPGKRQKDTLRELQVRPSKERGQNFLIRPEVPQMIADFGAVPSDKHVVEIGPGTGALTECLSKYPHLTLIEIEPSFCERLRGLYPHAKIVNEDVRYLDLSELGSELYVYGNIPYVFSTEIVFHLVAFRAAVHQAVLMTQKEFAQRIAAPPGSRTYGSISVAVQLFADVELGMIVSGDSFHPPTEVESQVLKLTFRKEPRYPVTDYVHFQSVVRASFSQRRKKIINSLVASGRWGKEQLVAALNSAGISPDTRAEQVSVEQFAALDRALGQNQ
jgi:16S rRNA (adenine1518-N6/adenine1519-N6)-dimethyltransferase